MSDTVVSKAQGFDVGVDIGGTFTDVVCRSASGELKLVKIPTTRANPSAGVLHAVEHMAREWDIAPRQHRALRPRHDGRDQRGARAQGREDRAHHDAGFRDVLEIGRQSRRNVYSVMLKPETPGFLAPGALRREVPERITARRAKSSCRSTKTPCGAKRTTSRRRACRRSRSRSCSPSSIPTHERRAAEIVREAHPELMVSISSEVDPAFREYERTCITAFDAYLKPVIDRYLAEHGARSRREAASRAPLQIMQSRGGVASSRIARRSPVRLFLSGPAAGVIGGRMAGAGRRRGRPHHDRHRRHQRGHRAHRRAASR